jgi:thioredoxin-like negative regulator of GroEL
MRLNKLFGRLRPHAKNFHIRNQMAELRGRAQENPDNLYLQIRMADLFIKLGKKEEALKVYRQAAEKYAQKDFVRQATALNKIILRLSPSQVVVDTGSPELYGQRVDDGYFGTH